MARASSQSAGLLSRIESLSRADTGTWLHIASVVAMLFVGGGLGLVALFALGKIEVFAATSLSGRPPALVIEWPRLEGAHAEDAGTWMPASLRAELETLALSQVVVDDPLSGESLAKIGSALAASGWFEGRPVVRRSYRGEQPVIHISGMWRPPVGVVRYDELDYLVAAGGRLLPARYSAGTSGMPLVIGTREPPPSHPETGALAFGQSWPGREVQAGLELVEILGRMPFHVQVAGVDVARFAHTGQVEIVTDRDTRVLWGGPPSRPLPGEIKTEAKLALLLDIARRYGRIDAGQHRIEIFNDRVVIDRTAGAVASAGTS